MANKPAKSNVIAVEHLSWHANGRPILADISFAIAQGEFVGLIGANGAGKSSLLRCLYKYIDNYQGTIRLNQTDIKAISAKLYAQQVAVVLQETPQVFQFTVRQLVAMGRVPFQSWLSAVRNDDFIAVRKALQKVGLEEKIDHDFQSLSGGEKQRVMIAKAIIQNPTLLIMDEPTSHLDVKYQIQIMELAKSLGITVIASFHDLNLAASICDSLIMLRQGQVAAYGKPHEVITEQNISHGFNVCASVQVHPQTQAPLVTYYYGYQQDINNES